jgi:hypothetical protein
VRLCLGRHFRVHLSYENVYRDQPLPLFFEEVLCYSALGPGDPVEAVGKAVTHTLSLVLPADQWQTEVGRRVAAYQHQWLRTSGTMGARPTGATEVTVRASPDTLRPFAQHRRRGHLQRATRFSLLAPIPDRDEEDDDDEEDEDLWADCEGDGDDAGDDDVVLT